jgi:hypothetical protein
MTRTPGALRLAAAAWAGLTLGATGCGYHVAGRADLLPKNLHTIAIPPFGNATTRYRLTERLPMAISRELIARTRYRVVADPGQADATLEGSILNYQSYPTLFDPTTGRASGAQMIVTMAITLRERKTGKVLFSRPYFDYRQRYEVSTDPKAYFEESETGLDRLSRDVAGAIVSGIVEIF